MRYRFRDTAIRENYYAGRWTIATLVGAMAFAKPAHRADSGSPGLVTNGWAPYGDNLQPKFQAAWNSGHNLAGDVVGWDDIVPSDAQSFTVTCSNFMTVATTASAAGGGSTPVQAIYCYAVNAIMLAELPLVPTRWPLLSSQSVKWPLRGKPSCSL